MNPRQPWQERVVELEEYVLENELSMREAGEELGYSAAHIHEDMKLAAGLRVYPDIEKLGYKEAGAFLRKKGFKR